MSDETVITVRGWMAGTAPASPVVESQALIIPALCGATPLYLHASCSDEWYGPITRVGKDANGRDVIDFEVSGAQINDFLDTDVERKDENDFDNISLARLVLPGDARATLTNVPILSLDPAPEGSKHPYITLDTPGHGCYRCTKLFSLHTKKEW